MQLNLAEMPNSRAEILIVMDREYGIGKPLK
jgi:hypothetical protein